MQTGVQVSITLPPLEIERLDHLVQEQKKATGNKKYSRSLYVRDALDIYLQQNIKEPPSPLPKGDTKIVGRKPVVLLLDVENHLKPIAKVQDDFKVDQVQVIRQAIIDRAQRDGNPWIDWASIIETPKPVPVDPKYEDVWLRAPLIYKSLGMNRNTLRFNVDKYNVRSHVTKEFSSRIEREYNFADIIRVLRLSEEDINKILGHGKGKK